MALKSGLRRHDMSFNSTSAVHFLGVFFDPNLSYKFHTGTGIKQVSFKLIRALKILRASKNLLSTRAKKIVYYSLFHCHLVFCLPIWSCSSNYLLKNLTIFQKQAVRIVTNTALNHSPSPPGCFVKHLWGGGGGELGLGACIHEIHGLVTLCRVRLGHGEVTLVGLGDHILGEVRLGQVMGSDFGWVR